MVSALIEFKKLLRRRKYIALTLTQLAVCALVMIGANAADTALSTDVLDIGVPITLGVMTAEFIPNSGLQAILFIVLPLLIFMMTSDAFAHEMEDGTIRCQLLRPVSRAKAFVSKLIAVWAYSVGNLIITWLLFAALQTAFFGFTAGAARTAASYIWSAVPIIPFITMSAFIAVAVGNSTLSMFVSLIAYIVMFAATLLSPTVGAVFFINHMGFYKHFLGLAVNWVAMGTELLLILSTASLLGLAAFALFDRKQI
jgi:ABC-2 type transport system permease protein